MVQINEKKSLLYSSFFSATSKVLTYILLLLLANIFLISEYGEAVFALSIFRLILLFSLFSIADLFTPMIINKKDTASVFYFLLFEFLILTSIGILISMNNLWILPLVISAPFFLFFSLSLAIFKTQHKYHLEAFYNALMMLVTLISILFLKNYGKFGIVFSYSMGYILVSLITTYLNRKEIYSILSKFQIKIKSTLGYLKKGFIASLILVSFAFLQWVDSTILGILSTFENVARYNIVGPISNLIALIPLSLSLFVLTRSSEIKNESKSRLILKRVIRISFTISLIIAILLNSLIYPIIKTFFPKYIGTELYFMVLSIGILSYSIYSIINSYLLGKLKPEKSFIPIVLAAIINIVLDIILIPKYQLLGIVIATTIAHLTALIMLSFIARIHKKLILFLILFLAIPISFYLQIYGILIINPAMFLLLLFRLINKEDLSLLYQTLKSSIKR